jgi:hypothetical protein
LGLCSRYGFASTSTEQSLVATFKRIEFIPAAKQGPMEVGAASQYNFVFEFYYYMSAAFKI